VKRCGWEDEITASVGIRFGGWFYWDSNYPDEGYVGPFEKLEYCVSHLFEAGYSIDEILEPTTDRAQAEKAKVMQLIATNRDSLQQAPRKSVDDVSEAP